MSDRPLADVLEHPFFDNPALEDLRLLALICLQRAHEKECVLKPMTFFCQSCGFEHPGLPVDSDANRTGLIIKGLVNPEDSNPTLLSRVEAELAAKGQKIAAIKLVRARTNLGLKEAKELVESYVQIAWVKR